MQDILKLVELERKLDTYRMGDLLVLKEALINVLVKKGY